MGDLWIGIVLASIVSLKCHAFNPPMDFSSFLPEPTHQKPFQPPDDTPGGSAPKKEPDINITSLDERMTSLEDDIRTFVPGETSETNHQVSPVDELKAVVKQVTDKEQALLTKLSTLGAKLDALEADDLAKAQAAADAENQRSTKAGSDSSTVNSLSQKYNELDAKLKELKTASTTVASTKADLYAQAESRANSLASTISTIVDDKVNMVNEHSQMVASRSDSVDNHCTTIDLQGLKAMEEAKKQIDVIDYLRPSEAHASSESFGTRAESIIDGSLSTSFFDRTVLQTSTEYRPWCFIKLARRSAVSAVRIRNRGDCCYDRMHNIEINVIELDPILYTWDEGQQCAYLTDQIGPGETYVAQCKYTMTGSYIRIKRYVDSDSLNVAEVQAIGQHLDIVAEKPTIQSSTEDPKWGAMMAVDADPKTCSQTRSFETDREQYWIIDLEESYKIKGVKITNRDDENWIWLTNIQVDLYTTFPDACSGLATGTTCRTYPGTIARGVTETLDCWQQTYARYVKIWLPNQTTDRLSLCEVNVLFSYF